MSDKRYALFSCFESGMNLLGVFENKQEATNELKNCLLEDLCENGYFYTEGVLRGDHYCISKGSLWAQFYDDDDNCYSYEVFEV